MRQFSTIFLLSLFSFRGAFAQCDGTPGQCLGIQSYTVDPAAINNQYNGGQVVTFCYTMQDYNQCNANWLHTINLTLGAGWDPSSITVISLPSSCDGQGFWGFYESTTSTATGLSFGPCFSYDSPSGSPGFVLDTIPGNNYGDNCTTYTWTYCFSIQVAAGCNNQSLNLDVTALGDGTGGSWSSNTCPGDPFNICSATCSSCHLHTANTIVNPSCANNDGTIALFPDSAVGSPSFSWFPDGQTTSSITGLSEGTYIGTVTDSVGCVTVDTFVLVADTVSAIFDTINLTCINSNDGSISVIPTDSVSPYTFIWMNANGDTVQVDNGSIGDTLTSISAGTYTVIFVNALGCTLEHSYTVTQPSYDAQFGSSPQFVCDGTPVQFTNSSFGNISFYNWTFGDGGSSTQQNPTYVFTGPGTYTVTLVIHVIPSCTDTFTQIITIYPNITGGFTSSPPYCVGEEIQFTDASVGNPASWDWSFGDGGSSSAQNPLHAYNTSGDYTINFTAIDSFCGTTQDSKTISVYDFPTPSLHNDTILCEGSVIELAANATGTSYLWSTGETTAAIDFVMPSDTIAIVWVTVDNNGCKASDSVILHNRCIVVLPSAFSPNEDGKNDLFHPLATYVSDYDFIVMNRWGQEVYTFSGNDVNKGWDGKLNGKEQPLGVYVYHIAGHFASGKPFALQGNVTLVR